MTTASEEFIKELRLASYAIASKGRWIERNGLLVPKNICTESADLIEWMVAHIELLESTTKDLTIELEFMARTRP